MYKLNLEKGVKANIWLNENLVECRCDDSKIIMEEQTNLFAKSRKIILELFLPRAHSNYALLGVDFLANGAGRSIIKWDIDCLRQERYSDAIALSFDTVIWGILDEFQEGIVQSLDYHRKEYMLPSGTVTYIISAYGEIGSSADMFRRLNDILLSLLICGELNESIIAKIVQEEFSIKPRLCDIRRKLYGQYI